MDADAGRTASVQAQRSADYPEHVLDGAGPVSGRTHGSVASRGVALRGVDEFAEQRADQRACSLDVDASAARATAPLSQPVHEAALEKFREPPGGDFHTHEYGVDPDAEEEGEAQRLVSTSTVPCERCTRDDPPELESSMVVFSFLLLTAGPSLTYLCFTLSVEYFVQDIGMQVLMVCGMAYSLPTMAGLLFYNASRFWLSPRFTLVSCLLTKTVFTTAIPVAVAVMGSIGGPLLYLCMAINGFCTGLVQSQVAAICGLLPGTRADSLSHVGGFLSAVMTTVVQGGLIAATVVSAPLSAKDRMYILFPCSALTTAMGLFAQREVLSMPTYVELAAREAARLRTLDKEAGKAKVVGRLGRIKWYLLGELITWFVGLYIGAVTPYLKSTSSGGFLVHTFATLQIMSFNVFNFAGSVVARKWVAWQRIGSSVFGRLSAWLPAPLQRSALACAVTGRLGFCILYILYGRSCGFGLSPTASVVLVMATFVVASFSNGFFTVSLSAECQNICGFKAKHTCPVIGALVWQAMQLGCVLGFVASYVTAPLIEPHACAF